MKALHLRKKIISLIKIGKKRKGRWLALFIENSIQISIIDNLIVDLYNGFDLNNCKINSSRIVIVEE